MTDRDDEQERGEIKLTCTYQGPLSAEGLAEMMMHAPNQVHWAPGQDGVTGYWFEVADDTVGYSGAFYVRADSPEAAQQHAELVMKRFRDHVQGLIRDEEQRADEGAA